MRANIPDENPNGLSGSIRLLGMALILTLAGLGIGVSLDVISLEMFGAIAKRVVLIACIGALACVGMALLMLKQPRNRT